MYIVVVYRSPPLVSTFYARLQLHHDVFRENKNIKLYIWPLFTCVNRTFDTDYPVYVSLLPLCFVRSRNSVYFLVRFPLSDERTWVARQENSVGADGESLLTTQPSHIWWDYKIYTRYLIYAFSAIQPSCLHSLNGHHPHCSIYPHPCWDYGYYSYHSLIRKKPLSVATPQFYRKFTSVDWVSGEQKKCIDSDFHDLHTRGMFCDMT